MGLGTFLILEGALVLSLMIARTVCVRLVDLESIPAAIRRRVLLGNRVAPLFVALSATMLTIGVIVGWAT